MFFITGNKHKYEEAKIIVGNDIEMLSISYPEIQADTPEEVARYGIEYLKERIDGDFFIEDSGLFIEALNGFPGVYSSYVFRTIGNEGILKLMEGVEKRKAQFVSVVGYYDGDIHIFRGESKGVIAYEIKGSEGFGYDPIFIPEGDKRTFGEMKREEKNLFSHRGKAMKKLKEYLASRI